MYSSENRAQDAIDRPATEMDGLISELSRSLNSIRSRISGVSLRVAGSAPPSASKAEVSRVAQTYGDHLRDAAQTVAEIDDLLSRIEGKI